MSRQEWEELREMALITLVVFIAGVWVLGIIVLTVLGLDDTVSGHFFWEGLGKLLLALLMASVAVGVTA